MQPSRGPRGRGSFSPLPLPPTATASPPSSPSPTFNHPARHGPSQAAPSSPSSPLRAQRSPRVAGHMRSRRVNSGSSDDSVTAIPPPLTINKGRHPHQPHASQPQAPPPQPPPPLQTPSYASFAAGAAGAASAAGLAPSAHSNYSRPAALATSAAAAATATSRQLAAAAAASAVGSTANLSMASAGSAAEARNTSPLTLPAPGPTSPSSAYKGHSRKHSQTAGLFDATLPSTTAGRPGGRSTSSPPPSTAAAHGPPRELNASQIAAQAAVLHQQQNQQLLQQQLQQQQHPLEQQRQQSHVNMQHQPQLPPPHQPQHTRQRSQTVPMPGETYENAFMPGKRGVALVAPPTLSLTEASAPTDSAVDGLSAHGSLRGTNHPSAAQTAASVVFSRSGAPVSPMASPHTPLSPHGTNPAHAHQAPLPPLPPPPPPPEKKVEKKVKLFSRPSKISVKGDPRDKPLPSPNKMGLTSALASLQRANLSTTSIDSTSGLYSLNNSSTATIRAADATGGASNLTSSNSSTTALGSGAGSSGGTAAVPEKEKKHHFLSRQKHKLKDKDDFHLPLSSAASNSRPTDPHAPNSLYNFSLPMNSPAPGATTFKGMSALDLRHGGRGLRDKKKDKDRDDKASVLGDADVSSPFGSLPITGLGGGSTGSDWPGPGSYGSAGGGFLNDAAADAGKFGLNNMSYDDAWPYLKAKLQVIFEGEDLRIPIEHLNRIVVMHIQYGIQRRSPNIVLEDLRDLLAAGFASLDRTLRMTPEDRLIPALVELWLFTFTSILPYMQAVFLPLDLEFSGTGTLLTPEQARDFWGGVAGSSGGGGSGGVGGSGAPAASSSSVVSPVSLVLDVRRLVLASYRDAVILPRYDTLKNIFSRLSLEFLPQSLAGMGKTAAPIPIKQKSRSNSALGQQYQQYSSYGNTGGHWLSTSPGTLDGARPGTATSLDPGQTPSSYNSNSTTLLGGGGGGSAGGSGPGTGASTINADGSRSRAISTVSFGSGSEPRPSISLGGGNSGGGAGVGGGYVPGSSPGSLREQNVEDSKQVTEMVGRMLQCMSVLAGVGVAGDGSDEGNKMVEELSRLLKLNWLGRGRTGRNRRGMVGGRVRRGGTGESREGVMA